MTLEQKAKEMTEKQKKDFQGQYVSGKAVVSGGVLKLVKVFEYSKRYAENLATLQNKTK